MKRAISYALFGYGKHKNPNCFDFGSYLTHFSLCLRMNRLIYPGWTTVLHVDQSTYDAFALFFDALKSEACEIIICEDAPLCKAMLWRLKPAFEMEGGLWKYEHVICRDLDSPSPYREAQCVQQWINNDKAMHAITDSISHTIPLMGGMIGVRPRYFSERMQVQTWDALLAYAPGMNYEHKGSDQDFLCRYVYPRFAQPGNDSITQHYILGHGNTWLSDFHNRFPEIELPIGEEMKESNDSCCHLGQSGWLLPPTWKFFKKHWEKFADILEAEKNYSQTFYWTQESCNG